MKKCVTTRQIAQCAVFAATALIVFIIEAQLPPLFINGIKPGLANAVILLCICYLGRRDAFFVLLAKIILSSLFVGTPISFIFSAAGGLSAFAVMSISILLFNGRLLFLSSVMGALAHNFAQLVTAYFILETKAVFAYAPYFVVASILIGCFTGLVSQFTLKKLPHRDRTSRFP